MARITVTLPESIHKQIIQISTEKKDSISYTVASLIEIGLIVLKNKEKSDSNELEEY